VVLSPVPDVEDDGNGYDDGERYGILGRIKYIKHI